MVWKKGMREEEEEEEEGRSGRKTSCGFC